FRVCGAYPRHYVRGGCWDWRGCDSASILDCNYPTPDRADSDSSRQPLELAAEPELFDELLLCSLRSDDSGAAVCDLDGFGESAAPPAAVRILDSVSVRLRGNNSSSQVDLRACLRDSYV